MIMKRIKIKIKNNNNNRNRNNNSNKQNKKIITLIPTLLIKQQINHLILIRKKENKKNGWYTINNKKYYYKNNVLVKNSYVDYIYLDNKGVAQEKIGDFSATLYGAVAWANQDLKHKRKSNSK